MNWLESETCNFSKVPLIIFPFARLLIMTLCKPECSKLLRAYLVSILPAPQQGGDCQIKLPFPNSSPWQTLPPPPQARTPSLFSEPFPMRSRFPLGLQCVQSPLFWPPFSLLKSKTKHGCYLKLWPLAFHSFRRFPLSLSHPLSRRALAVLRWPCPGYRPLERHGLSWPLQKDTWGCFPSNSFQTGQVLAI